MVFPVVMYGCESWTIKKAERQRIDAFELVFWRRLLRVPWTAKRSNQSILKEIRSDQIRSVVQSCLTLCDPMNRSTPGVPVHHHLPEFTQTHVHRGSDAIQPSHPLSSLNLLAVQGTLKSLLQHHSSKASIFRCSAFFIIQLSHPYITTVTSS